MSNQVEIYVSSPLTLLFYRWTFHLHLCGGLFVCFPHLQRSNKSLVQRSNTVTLLISIFCSRLWSVRVSLYTDYITAVTFSPAANGFLMDSLFLTPSWAHLCTTVSQPPALLQLAGDALLIKWQGRPIGPRAQGGKEGIDLSVVLEDQLIPIVCASTDSPMCLIWYGLFLLRQDKSLSHHFPL